MAATQTLASSLVHAEDVHGVLARLSPADQRLVDLNKLAGIALRSLTPNTLATGCIFASEERISFRKWLDMWIRQTLQRCPPGVATTASRDCPPTIAAH